MKVSEALSLYGKNGPITVIHRGSAGDPWGRVWVVYAEGSKPDSYLYSHLGESDVFDIVGWTDYAAIDWFEHPPTVTTQTPSHLSPLVPSIFSGKQKSDDLIDALNYVRLSDVPPGCPHQLTQYTGLFETYPMCAICGVKL